MLGATGNGSGQTAIVGECPEGGTGVEGFGLSRGVRGASPEEGGVGVEGIGKAAGVFGHSDAGPAVHGNGVVGILGEGSKVGVRGASASGTGVIAEAYPEGTGKGTALLVRGRPAFSTCGTIVVPAGAASATVNALLGTNPVVLAIAQDESTACYVTAAVPDTATGTVKVVLNQAPTAPLSVGWFVLETVPPPKPGSQ
jgi:hypothetical protein